MHLGMNSISDRIWLYFGDLGARLEIFVSFYWHQVIWKAAHSSETATERGRIGTAARGDRIGVASPARPRAHPLIGRVLSIVLGLP